MYIYIYIYSITLGNGLIPNCYSNSGCTIGTTCTSADYAPTTSYPQAAGTEGFCIVS